MEFFRGKPFAEQVEANSELCQRVRDAICEVVRTAEYISPIVASQAIDDAFITAGFLLLEPEKVGHQGELSRIDIVCEGTLPAPTTFAVYVDEVDDVPRRVSVVDLDK